jgi:serine/threonine-protein kinase HipA
MNYDFCLCCLKKLDGEKKGFHKKCLKKFFGTARPPEIELSEEILESLAQKSTSKGITVAGVQKKLSLHLFSEKGGASRLTLTGYPQGYILKPQSADFAFLPESEQIVMTMADAAGIQTVPHSLICVSDNSNAYITGRIDRTSGGEKIHMEDFCQLSERLTEDKYKGSYEQCAKIIRKFSSRPGIDLSDFFYRLLFCFVTGNSDMHLKNFSLIKNLQTGDWTLSKAYDLLPVNLLMPSDTEETALTLNGKKSRLRRTDFLELAKSAAIPEKAAQKMMEDILSKKGELLSLAKSPLLPQEMQEEFIKLIEERCSRLAVSQPGQ